MSHLKAYIDESYVPNGVFVLAGYISTQKRWAEFSAEWEQLLRPFGTLKEGTSEYHFKYSEMTINEERRARISLFEQVAQRHALMAISCMIDAQELRRTQARIQVPGIELDFGHFGNPYLFSYRCLMDKFHSCREVLRDVIDPSQKVDFIFDEQINDKKAILRSWHDYISNRSDEAQEVYGAPPTFSDDRVSLPLQAADLWAGMIREAYVGGKADDVFKRSAKEDSPNQAFPCAVMEWTEDAIVEDLKKLVRSETDAPIYDVRWGAIDLG